MHTASPTSAILPRINVSKGVNEWIDHLLGVFIWFSMSMTSGPHPWNSSNSSCCGTDSTHGPGTSTEPTGTELFVAKATILICEDIQRLACVARSKWSTISPDLIGKTMRCWTGHENSIQETMVTLTNLINSDKAVYAFA